MTFSGGPVEAPVRYSGGPVEAPVRYAGGPVETDVSGFVIVTPVLHLVTAGASDTVNPDLIVSGDSTTTNADLFLGRGAA